MTDSARIFCDMSRFGVKDRLQWIVESDREDVSDHPGAEDVAASDVSSPSERFHRNLALIRAYEARANESPSQARSEANRSLKG
jgi:hypothetical protein